MADLGIVDKASLRRVARADGAGARDRLGCYHQFHANRVDAGSFNVLAFANDQIATCQRAGYAVRR